MSQYCKICANIVMPAFRKKVLHKYDVQYYICNKCMFMQTDDPFWLTEAYSDAINATDLGLISRNKIFTELVSLQLRLIGGHKSKYLDYGGGYGMFVRMMRDSGYDFYCYDQYCENIFSKNFMHDDPAITSEHYQAITAFEVFEHLEHPISEIEKLLAHTDTILFSTELTSSCTGNIEDWWYVMPEHGQHIAFYHRKTLEFISKKYKLNLYTNNRTLHMLTKHSVNPLYYKFASSYVFTRMFNTFFNKKSLLAEDYSLSLQQNFSAEL